MASETLIEASALNKRYGPNHAVIDLNLELKTGDILGLLGPNGAGKSTTLKMLTGCLAPTSGNVRIHGVDLHTHPRRAKASLGYLPERPPVYAELSVDEYLGFCARLHGVPATRRRSALESAKRDCGLTEMGRRTIANLSKGYRQRVGLAQAIIHRPAMIILDEPTVGLDPIQIREIRKLINDLARSHSVILSSHNLSEIQATCNRVMIIHRGRMVLNRVLDDTPTEKTPERILVGLRNPPEDSELQDIPGVSSVQHLEEGLLRLSCAHGEDPREAVLERAQARHWGLYELHGETKTLEETFVEITSTDKPVESTEEGAAA